MALSVSNTLVYREDWATRLQERLEDPALWKDVCRVEYTNTRVLNNPYLADLTVQSGLARGSAYAFQDLTETNETRTINVRRDISVLIDRADFAQSSYLRQMELADLMGLRMSRAIDAYVLLAGSTAGQLQQLLASDLPGGSGTSITVSITNVDDIIRTVRRLIFAARGGSEFNENGGYVVWRPADFALLEAFAQANGWSVADHFLTSGVKSGFHYMGFDHYVSNDLPGGRLQGGVKRTLHLGILRDTFGQLMVDEKDPGQVSGIGFNLRTDMVITNWELKGSLVFDIAVA